MPLLKRKRVLAAKIESTPGTAETLTTADATYNVYDPMIQANITVDPRERQGSFANIYGITGQRTGTCTFSTDLEWDGTATEPAWAEAFFPACGWVKTSNVYNPVDQVPGSNVKTLTLGLYVDGKRKTLRGASGTFKIIFPVGQLARIEWTFTGVWDTPTDTAIITPTHTTDNVERYAATTTTWDGNAFCASSIEIDAGNQVVPLECSTDASGIDYFLITGRELTVSADPEEKVEGTEPHYTDWLAHTVGALVFQLTGWTGGDDVISFQVPAAQITNVQEGDRNGIVTSQVNWRGLYNANGEMYVTFSPTV